MNITKVLLFFAFAVCVSCRDPTKNDIKIYFHTSSDPNNAHLVDISQAEQVAKSGFSASKDTVFYIHGWLDESSSWGSQLIKNNVLKYHDVNMFIVDWNSLAKNVLYPVVASYVQPVGNIVGELISALAKGSHLNLAKTTIVGHSLGAHVAGVAGRHLGGGLGQVVGLDPAGPAFSAKNTANRLTAASAKFVQAIHTCGSELGYFDPVGHADYYPNGGGKQPMCGLDATGKCSHLKAIDYYAESLMTGNFKARNCPIYKDYTSGKCNNAEASDMGGYILDTKAHGTFFLTTNNNSPYAKN